jgi:hypothetical protein
MILFCARPECGRGFVPLIRKGQMVPTLCPTCRHGIPPLALKGSGKAKCKATKAAAGRPSRW